MSLVLQSLSKTTSKIEPMAKTSITLIGNGKMAFALAQGLKESYTLEVIGRSKQKLDEFEAQLGIEIEKTL